jgi:hypothetical protein
MFKLSLAAIFSIFLLGNTQTDLVIRNQFQEAIYSKKTAEKLAVSLESKPNLSAIEMGYLGATKMVLAKHYFNPYEKLKSFNNGRIILEKAIKQEPSNIEIIYLRYSCAKNAPSFLNYNKTLESDRILLENSAKNLTDMDLKNRILNFLKK